MVAIQLNIIESALNKYEVPGEKNDVKIDKALEIPTNKENQKKVLSFDFNSDKSLLNCLVSVFSFGNCSNKLFNLLY